MSDSHRPKDDHEHPSTTAASRSETRQRAWEAVETAKDTLARTHQALAHTRELRKAKGEILQYNRARREHKAEHAALPSPTPPRPVIDILLIEDSRADAVLFRHVLKLCELSCQLTVLKQRSEVEAFVSQAATTKHPSLPRLIIADCMIPGMEAEDIMAAVRTVPAYQHVPVLLFSTLAEEEGQRRCVRCGATAFVHKPGELRAFETAVVTMVGRWGGIGDGSDPTPTRDARGEEEGGEYQTSPDS